MSSRTIKEGFHYVCQRDARPLPQPAPQAFVRAATPRPRGTLRSSPYSVNEILPPKRHMNHSTAPRACQGGEKKVYNRNENEAPRPLPAQKRPRRGRFRKGKSNAHEMGESYLARVRVVSRESRGRPHNPRRSIRGEQARRRQLSSRLCCRAHTKSFRRRKHRFYTSSVKTGQSHCLS